MAARYHASDNFAAMIPLFLPVAVLFVTCLNIAVLRPNNNSPNINKAHAAVSIKFLLQLMVKLGKLKVFCKKRRISVPSISRYLCCMWGYRGSEVLYFSEEVKTSTKQSCSKALITCILVYMFIFISMQLHEI